MFKQKLYENLSNISRKLTFLPRGKAGVMINKLLIQDNQSQIQTFRANNNLIYKCDLRSYTENYVPWTGEYEGKTMNMILPMIDVDKNVLDIGGNVGFWTINIASKLNQGKVYTFEPVLSNYNRIIEHLEINNLQDKVKVFNIGLSDHEAKANFVAGHDDVSNNAGTFNASLSEDENGVCEIKVLDKVAQQNGIGDIGFIKIDVEGYEIRCFKGALELITSNRPIIYGEFTPEPITDLGDNPLELYRLLPEYTFYQENSNSTFTKLEHNQLYKRDILLIPNEHLESITNRFEQFFN